MQMYVTSALQRNDIKAAALQLADAQEGEERSAHWAEGSNERWPSQLDQSFYEGDRAVKPRNDHIFR